MSLVRNAQPGLLQASWQQRREMKTARTLIAGLLLPGLGFVVVDRLRLGIAAAALFFASILVFSLTRLVLVPSGYYAMCAIAISVSAWAVAHSTWIAYSIDAAAAPKMRWMVIAVFVSIIIVAASATVWSRAANLGYETFRLPSNSMSPTLVAGDYILVDTWRYSEVDPQFGDLVVFYSPDQPGVSYVKRVIGVPGDSLELRNNALYLNGKLIKESYVFLAGGSPQYYRNHKQATIAPDEYFVLGDNRDNSRDSRFFGPVSRENIKGRVAHRWYSSESKFPIVLDFAVGVAARLQLSTTEPGSQRYSVNHALDVRISRDFDVRYGDITVFMDVTNLYDRANTCCIEYSLGPGTGGVPVLLARERHWLPLVPSLGVVWRF